MLKQLIQLATANESSLPNCLALPHHDLKVTHQTILHVQLQCHENCQLMLQQNFESWPSTEVWYGHATSILHRTKVQSQTESTLSITKNILVLDLCLLYTRAWLVLNVEINLFQSSN